MEPEYSKYAARAQIALLRGLPYDYSMDFEHFVVPPNIRQTSLLWHLGLALALLNVVFSTLAKCTIAAYLSRTRSQAASLRHWARRFIVLNQSLRIWRIADFVATLPLLLHLSLLMFLGGLSIFLSDIDRAASIIIAATLLFIAVFLSFTGSIALHDPSSPFPSPMMPMLYGSWRCASAYAQRIRQFGKSEARDDTAWSSSWTTYRDNKVMGNERSQHQRDTDAVIWMAENVASPQAVAVAVDAIGSFKVQEYNGAVETQVATVSALRDSHAVTTAVTHRLQEFLHNATENHDAVAIARLLRTILYLGRTFDSSEAASVSVMLERWSHLKTYDIDLMTRCILLNNYHLRNFGQDVCGRRPSLSSLRLSEVERWSQHRAHEQPYLLSTLELVTKYSLQQPSHLTDRAIVAIFDFRSIIDAHLQRAKPPSAPSLSLTRHPPKASSRAEIPSYFSKIERGPDDDQTLAVAQPATDPKIPSSSDNRRTQTSISRKCLALRPLAPLAPVWTAATGRIPYTDSASDRTLTLIGRPRTLVGVQPATWSSRASTAVFATASDQSLKGRDRSNTVGAFVDDRGRS